MALLSNLKRYIASFAVFALVFGAVLPASLIANTPIAKAATFTVTNLLDDGVGSLRAAIIAANGTPGADIIDFDPALNGTITLLSNLPAINETLEIRGDTANDAGGGPDIILDGTGRNFVLALQEEADIK